MPETIIPNAQPLAVASRPGWVTRHARRLLMDRLDVLEGLDLTLIENETPVRLGQRREDSPPITLRVHDSRFYRDVLLGGHLGAAEAYIHGMWDCDNLTALIRVFARNLDQADHIEGGAARVIGWLARAWHHLNRNTLTGSKRNILAHYDIGNDFFQLFLDPTMTYSCALFDQPNLSLIQAQAAKYDRICRAIDLKEDDHLIEIGTGWGGFAIHAAHYYGARITTTTISDAQHEIAQDRIRRTGLEPIASPSSRKTTATSPAATTSSSRSR